MARGAAAQQALQREYYSRTAGTYDEVHNSRVDEHQFALAFMRSAIDLFGIRSVLDIGSGTGRALQVLKESCPHLRVVGVEPSDALREIGYAKGLRRDELIDGDARSLAYADGEFDLVSEFGTLHHIPKPERAVSEMLRVARVGVFISDGNNYGQGSPTARAAKSVIRSLGLWPIFDKIRTRGKGYMENEGDGLFYSYSVFDSYPAVRRACASVHILNTQDAAGIQPRRASSHVALLGLKPKLLQCS